ncbi:MAG: methyltransferase domain-containing protein [Oscillospiraceae bacterium]|nr:methyltransferase domain-containing protein [Oscillospiraceae bacterium]
MQLWFEDMIRFMRDASEYGTYNQELVKRLAPDMTKDMHICDAGCGLGYLSLELAPYVGRISAVEKNAEPLRVLEENCRARGITNISIRNGAIQNMAPQEKYDAMVFCFFGRIHEILDVAKRQCKGNVFIITRTYTSHRFSVGHHPTGSYGYRSSQEVLRDLGIPYEETRLALEFGQPFRSLEDARRFFEIYSKDEDKSDITDEFLLGRLVKIEHPQFPYYMPHLRNLAILKFHTADIKE